MADNCCTKGKGKCSSTWEDLCSLIGDLCLNLEKSVGGLIRNQAVLRDQTMYYDSRAESFAACTALFLDTSACTIVDTANSNTIPLGGHVGNGYVSTGSNVICVKVAKMPDGSTPPACTPIDRTFTPTTTSTNAYGYTLNVPSGTECTKVLVGCVCEPTSAFKQSISIASQIVTNNDTYVTHPGVKITIPKSGYYQHNCTIDGGNYAGTTMGTFIAKLKVNGAASFNLYQEMQVFPSMRGWGWGNSVYYYRNAGDILEVEYLWGSDASSVVEVNAVTLQVFAI